MKYMGSKARIAKEILPIILKNRTSEEQYYVEPFVGGGNSIDKVRGRRMASDNNRYLIAMWVALQNYWIPQNYTKHDYEQAKRNKEKSPHETGYIGFNCSYCGKFFAGYAGVTSTKTGIRDYQQEALNNVLKQIDKLRDVEFYACPYDELDIPPCSIIYCDIPYKDTTKYNLEFDYEKFYEWCRGAKARGHEVFISEYSMPDDFTCVWQKEVKSSLSANGNTGESKRSIERLFTIL